MVELQHDLAIAKDRLARYVVVATTTPSAAATTFNSHVSLPPFLEYFSCNDFSDNFWASFPIPTPWAPKNYRNITSKPSCMHFLSIIGNQKRCSFEKVYLTGEEEWSWGFVIGEQSLVNGRLRSGGNTEMEVQHREGSPSPSRGCSGRRWSETLWQQRRERERGKSCIGAKNKKGVREIETLNKSYGFGSFNNRSHIPLFGTESCWTEAYSSLWHRFWANRGL